MSSLNHDAAAAMAQALRAGGVQSDITEVEPHPFVAAQEAFFICHGRDGRAWIEMREAHTAESVPLAAYHRKLAEFCRRALRHPLMPDDLRESVTYAWGYFRGRVKGETMGQSSQNDVSGTDIEPSSVGGPA